MDEFEDEPQTMIPDRSDLGFHMPPDMTDEDTLEHWRDDELDKRDGERGLPVAPHQPTLPGLRSQVPRNKRPSRLALLLR